MGYRKLGFRTGGMLDRIDTGQVGFRTGGMQDRKDQEWRDAGKER